MQLNHSLSQDLKLKYYDLMIQHALHRGEYLDVAKHYYKVWETPSIMEDKSDKGKAVRIILVLYSLLSPN
jgi:26S proteasome regulatory subunit N5